MSAPYRSWPTGGRPYDPADLIEADDAATEPPGAPPLAERPALQDSTGLDIDPVTGYILAPLVTGADGKVSLNLDALSRGIVRGVLDVADAPQGARNAAAKIDGKWVWRLVRGEGWAVREGKGPERSNGTRPRLTILEPCASVTLRAVGIDVAFPDTTHHVVLAWVRLTRGNAWKAEAGWAGSTEPSAGLPIPGGRIAIRRGWTAGPRRIGVTACRGVLAVPPDARVIETALAAAEAATAGPAGFHGDQDVST